MAFLVSGVLNQQFKRLCEGPWTTERHQSTEVDFQKSTADNKPRPLTGEEQHGCGRQSQEEEYN